MLVAAVGIDIACELPAALVTISKAPSFVGTCDANEVIELDHRLGFDVDCTPVHLGATRGVFVTTPSDGLAVQIAVLDSDGEHVVAPWIEVTWRAPSTWWWLPKFRVVDLDGDGTDEIVMTEASWSSHRGFVPAHDVRVFVVEHGRLVLAGRQNVDGDDRDAIVAARHIYDHRARE